MAQSLWFQLFQCEDLQPFSAFCIINGISLGFVLLVGQKNCLFILFNPIIH